MTGKILLFNLLLPVSFLFSQTPSFQWAKRMGGNGNDDKGYSIKVDAFGNVYTTGTFSLNADVDPGPATYSLFSQGGLDVYVSKLDPSGAFLWGKSFGGINNDYGYSIVLDNFSNVYTIGSFSGTVDFDPGPTVYTLTTTGNLNTFISKLDASGNFIWAKNIDASGGVEPYSISIDGSGNLFVRGYFYGTGDFDPGPGIYNLTGPEGFIMKLDQFGGFLWAKNIPATHQSIHSSIIADATGNVYTIGQFGQTQDFDSGPGTFNLTSNGSSDIFLLKLDPSGNFVWAGNMGGPQNDIGQAITVDASGNVCITGAFSLTADFDPGPGTYTLSNAGFFVDIFIAKYTPSGNIMWAKSIGGPNPDYGNSITTNLNRDIYTLGSFDGIVDFDPGLPVNNLNSADGNLFVSKFDSLGMFIWAKNIGDNAGIYGSEIAVDLSNNVYFTGLFGSTVNFNPGPGMYTIEPIGNSNIDIFITKWKEITITVSVDENSTSDKITIFPNPNNGFFNLQTDNNFTRGQLILVNSIGQKVHEQKIHTGTNEIIVNKFTKGLYNYIFLDEKGKKFNGKFLIE